MTTNPRVIVLHGHAVRNFATRQWRSHLQADGLEAIAHGYRSIRHSLDENVERLASHVHSLPGDSTVHFVGHSLGGIVILQTLARHRFAQTGRVVLVGSPILGSAAARTLAKTAMGRWWLGKTMVQWQGVHRNQLPDSLQIGTIAGIRPFGLGMVISRLTLPHDGTVCLSEATPDWATDRLVVPVSHTGLLVSGRVTAQISEFLRRGRFTPAPIAAQG